MVRNSWETGMVLATVIAFAVTACNGDADPAGQPPAEEPDAQTIAELPVCDEDNGGLRVQEGFCALVVHDGVGPARHLTVGDNGDIYVRLSEAENGGGIVALRDTDGDGRADQVEYFGNEDTGTGIAVYNGHLYFSSDTEVFRQSLAENGALIPDGEVETVITGFPDQSGHAAKPFTFDDAGHIYVNIGSPTNNCQPQDRDREAGVEGQDPCAEFPEQASIWRFDAETAGQSQGSEGEPYIVGFRNAVALDWNRAAEGLYAVQHGRDLLAGWPNWTEEENAELPSEEFHRLEEGDTLAYPYCFHHPERNEFVRAPEYGGDGQTTQGCEGYPAPLEAYPAHFAPNDLHFYTGTLFDERYRNGAFIAWHGSWNRAPQEQRGYKITFQPMNGAEPAESWEIFADGFAGVETIQSPGDAAYRPMGLAEGPDGSLYVSDSVEGRIWRIIPENGESGTSGRSSED